MEDSEEWISQVSRSTVYFILLIHNCRSSTSAPHAEDNSDALDSDSKPKANPRSIEKEYAIAARAVARCVDLFCHPRKVVDHIVLLKEEEAVKKDELEESEAERKRWKALLWVM